MPSGFIDFEMHVIRPQVADLQPLYVAIEGLPRDRCMGAGTQLIDAAKATGIGALELWCFQGNERARRFYEARGFRAIRFTDGAQNEEHMPDVRYRWEFPATTSFEDKDKRGSGI